ncbi:capsule polysaccharide biosynthesis protein [Thiorhodovibrio frisius]|uniref:Capsule polysaccharide biosynthesis protein n=1 Tax=Thiorhodovibrio frisius TaxID=631362 RepID=H8YWC3_9GAMM|nr:capsule polysaccharide biosynthesis protein [Thiorhodovibrio frisius]EIC23726.1 Capsule polysaccharide biosynthesis protein [Thiorhodovibrio frisius]WPL20124.1 Capsule polysaccharide biosynthesis protein [Thiorhodovibrio frisius]
MKHKVAILDGFNVNPRNFPTLFSAFKDMHYLLDLELTEWKPLRLPRLPPSAVELHEKYRSALGIESDIETEYQKLTEEEVVYIENRFLSVFREELLLNLREEIHHSELPITSENIRTWFEVANAKKAYQQVIVHCNAWLKYWKTRYGEISKTNELIFVFSGKKPYQMAFHLVFQYSPTTVYCIESLFNKEFFLCAELYEPIGNSPYLLPFAQEKSLEAIAEDYFYSVDLHKLTAGKSLNATHPVENSSLHHNQRYGVIICQVMNDVTITKYLSCSPVQFYMAAAKRFLQDDLHVIFRLHPWEIVCNGFSPTEVVLRNMLAKEGMGEDRVSFDSKGNVFSILSRADAIYAISSQTLIQASAMGVKVIHTNENYVLNDQSSLKITMPRVRWTPCQGQFFPEFKLAHPPRSQR